MLIRIASSSFIFSSSFNVSLKVLGSIVGNILMTNGSASAMNRTSMKTLMKTRRNTSVTVRRSYFLSQQERVDLPRVQQRM